MASGKSKSQSNKFGSRRIVNGKELAPRSLRHKHTYLSDCSDEELIKAQIKN